MADDSLVQIHLGRTAALCSALGEAAVGYQAMARRVRPWLDVAGADPAGQRGLIQVARRLDELRGDLRLVQLTVLEAEAGAGPALFDVSISHDPYDSPYVSDESARAAAAAAASAYERGDLAEFNSINAAYSTEIMYALELAGRFTPEMVIDAIDLYENRKPHRFLSDEARVAVLGVTQLLVTLSVASRAGGAGPSFPSLMQAIDREDPSSHELTRYKRLARLFEPDVSWSAEFLVAAARGMLLPANRDVLAGSDPTRYHNLEGVDVRVVLLEKLARNPSASSSVLNGDLGQLLPLSLAYGDRGQAMGQVLVSGTSPAAPLGSMRAEEVITHVARHRELAPMTQAALGAVAAPYMGSFRDLHYKAAPVEDLLPRLDTDDAEQFLAYASENEAARLDIQRATFAWSHSELDRMATQGVRDPAAMQVIGNVVGNSAGARYKGALAAHISEDRLAEEQKKLLGGEVALLADLLPPGLSSATSIGGTEAIGRVVGDPKSGTYGSDAPQILAADAAALASQVLGVQWAHHNQSHTFDSVSPAPELVAADGSLKAYRDLAGDTQRQAFRRWLSDLDRIGAVDFGSAAHGFADAGLGA